jgi:hypothetical protein
MSRSSQAISFSVTRICSFFLKIASSHNIVNPTDKDIVFAIDTGLTVPPVYWHWPPRPEVEVRDS